MGAFDSIYKASIGGADFQLDKVSESNSVQLDQSGHVESRNLQIAIEGWVEGTSGADLSAKIIAARAAFLASGQDFTITGLGGAKYCELLAATCLSGGPHLSFETTDDAPLVRRFKCTVTAQQRPQSGQDPPGFPAKEDTRHLTVTTTPDGLRTLSFAGTISGPGATAFFLNSVLTPLGNAYPAVPAVNDPAWVINHEYDVNIADDKLTYTVRIKELWLAFGVPLGAAQIVDGELIRNARERDGDRLLLTTSCDFSVLGDPEEVVKMIRPAAPAQIIRESVEVTTHQEHRLRARFTVLQSAEQNGLLEWESSFEVPGEQPSVRGVSYDGVRAALVYDQAVIRRLTISGRAVGIALYPIEPSVPFPKGYQMAEPPTVRFAVRNRYEKETSWTYSMIGTQGLGEDDVRTLGKAMARPAKPRFYKDK